MTRNKIRVLIAKPGLDGHDRGAKVVALGLRDAGMEVIYLGLRLTPEKIAEAAIQEGVDVVGVSCLSGAHMILLPRIVQLVRENSPEDVLFIGGGIIPQKDIPSLRDAGFAEIFGPGTPLTKISEFIESSMEKREDDIKN